MNEHCGWSEPLNFFVFRKNTFAWVTFMAEEKAEDKKYAILLR